MESLLHSVGLNMKKEGFMGLDEHSDTYFVDFGKGGGQSLGYGYYASHVDKEEFIRVGVAGVRYVRVVDHDWKKRKRKNGGGKTWIAR
ncbi:unnamed protein product [Linum trigynum]|uniref:Uncharacterized protein n=1 Tax=Linum trigynum TaxID=586398 RepID=A0AAV2E3K8_9ROSI